MMKVREAELDNQAETLRSKIKNNEDIIPSINDSRQVIVDNSLIGKSSDFAGTLTKESLIGNWKVIQEEVNRVQSQNVKKNFTLQNTIILD